MQSDRIDSLAVNFWRTTLKIFNAADFDIVPNEDISEKLAEFISALKAEDGEKTAVFDSGTTVGYKKICRLMRVIRNSTELRIHIDECRKEPHIAGIRVY